MIKKFFLQYTGFFKDFQQRMAPFIDLLAKKKYYEAVIYSN